MTSSLGLKAACVENAVKMQGVWKKDRSVLGTQSPGGGDPVLEMLREDRLPPGLWLQASREPGASALH